MIDKTLSVLFGLAVALLLIVIHELGHYTAGRLSGIPGSRMRFQVNKKIPQVALVNDNGSKVLSEDTEEYIKVLEQYLDSEKKIFLFVVGGHAFELIVISILVTASFLFESDLTSYLARTVTWIAPLMFLNYILFDVVATIRKKRPSGGDFSGLWAISPLKTVLFYIAYFIVISLWFFSVRYI